MQALGIKRDATECDLEFAGFVAISSPVKVDSKLNIKCILQASHHVSTLGHSSHCVVTHTVGVVTQARGVTTLTVDVVTVTVGVVAHRW